MFLDPHDPKISGDARRYLRPLETAGLNAPIKRGAPAHCWTRAPTEGTVPGFRPYR